MRWLPGTEILTCVVATRAPDYFWRRPPGPYGSPRDHQVTLAGAARRRSRERWLRQQAGEETSLRGLLVDLAERGTPVAVNMRGGRRHRGIVRAVGTDFVALASGAADVIVALAVVSSVRTRPGEVPPLGDRPVTTSLRLVEVLAELAAEREPALMTMSDGRDTVAGEVRSVGQDVVVVRTSGQSPAIAYVPLDAVGDLVLQPASRA